MLQHSLNHASPVLLDCSSVFLSSFFPSPSIISLQERKRKNQKTYHPCVFVLESKVQMFVFHLWKKQKMKKERQSSYSYSIISLSVIFLLARLGWGCRVSSFIPFSTVRVCVCVCVLSVCLPVCVFLCAGFTHLAFLGS